MAGTETKSETGQAPGAVTRPARQQYLEALRQGHIFPEPQKREAQAALLESLAAEEAADRELAAEVLENLPVFERWALGRLVDQWPGPERERLQERFSRYRVGLQAEDFAGAPARAYEAGAKIFGNGDPATEAFLVREGTVLVSKAGRRVATYGPGQFFGNLPFLLPVQRTADAFALTKVSLAVLPQADYRQKFDAFPARRQEDELRLAQAMLRQLITGLARIDSAQKGLADHLFPGQTRHEQEDNLSLWIEHFAAPDRFGPDLVFALFNVLEWLDRELPLLEHLDTADAAALASLETSGRGLLRGVGVSNLKTGQDALARLKNPPVLHRLTGALAAAPGLRPQSLEVMVLADFLWPNHGTRQGFLSKGALAMLAGLLHRQGVLYFAGTSEGLNFRRLCPDRNAALRLAPGLYALGADALQAAAQAPEQEMPTPESATKLFFKRLGGFWRDSR